jgi:hypothetical protein
MICKNPLLYLPLIKGEDDLTNIELGCSVHTSSLFEKEGQREIFQWVPAKGGRERRLHPTLRCFAPLQHDRLKINVYVLFISFQHML